MDRDSRTLRLMVQSCEQNESHAGMYFAFNQDRAVQAYELALTMATAPPGRDRRSLIIAFENGSTLRFASTQRGVQVARGLRYHEYHWLGEPLSMEQWAILQSEIVTRNSRKQGEE